MNDFPMLMFGVLLGFIFAIFLFFAFPKEKFPPNAEMIHKCEATLSRDTHCVITAVPEVKK